MVFSFNSKTGKWVSIKPGRFRILEHKTNAIVFTIDSSSDVLDKTGIGGWVETWNISLTHKDVNSIYIMLTRVVNNYLEPAEFDDVKSKGRFFYSFAGMLERK